MSKQGKEDMRGKSVISFNAWENSRFGVWHAEFKYGTPRRIQYRSMTYTAKTQAEVLEKIKQAANKIARIKNWKIQERSKTE